MNKIMIIGGCGSGKSTLAVKISQKTNIPLVHLDKLFWKENWTPVSKEDFDSKLISELERTSWIIDGNYNRTIKMRLKAADTIIFLDFPTYMQVYGIIKRFFVYHGRTRADMAENCPERFEKEFFLYTLHFNKKKRPEIYKMLKSQSSKNIYILKSRKDVKNFLDNI